MKKSVHIATLKLSTCFISAIIFCIVFNACGSLNQLVDKIDSVQDEPLTQFEMGQGLREALSKGVFSAVDILGQNDGYFANPMVRILLPEQLQKVDEMLRKIGLASLADQGLKILNKAAENAVSQAKPIFLEAISNLTFADALQILTGAQDAATVYLKNKTYAHLFKAFQPHIKNSLQKVGANKIWEKIINRYNSIPLIEKVNPNLSEYITEKAIAGLFKKIADKEAAIRSKIQERTSPILLKVFSRFAKN